MGSILRVCGVEKGDFSAAQMRRRITTTYLQHAMPQAFSCLCKQVLAGWPDVGSLDWLPDFFFLSLSPSFIQPHTMYSEARNPLSFTHCTVQKALSLSPYQAAAPLMLYFPPSPRGTNFGHGPSVRKWHLERRGGKNEQDLLWYYSCNEIGRSVIHQGHTCMRN